LIIVNKEFIAHFKNSRYTLSNVKLHIIIPSLVLLLMAPLIVFHFGLLSSSTVTKNSTALVLGAGILDNTDPSAVLKNRLNKSIELYNNGQVKYILVSGDNRAQNYNEPRVMRNYLVAAGIPDEAIVVDFAGTRTIESCWRAKNVFNASEIVVITQNFHLPRATYLCRQFGLQVKPLEAKNASYRGGLEGFIREIFASWSAIFDVLGFEGGTPPDGTEKSLN
jgi:SanA protein